MCVAHAEAAVVAAVCQPPPADEELACTLSLALKVGPAALASSCSVQQMLDYLNGRLEAGEVSFIKSTFCMCLCAHHWSIAWLTVVVSKTAALLMPLPAHALACLQASLSADSYSEMLKDCQELMSDHEPQPGDALELAQAAAARSCAYLRCANLADEGGPAVGQGAGSQRCSKCRVAWYCGTACSHADWRAGHRRMCRVLGAARAAQLEQEGGGL
jgi:hypothetical protein